MELYNNTFYYYFKEPIYIYNKFQYNKVQSPQLHYIEVLLHLVICKKKIMTQQMKYCLTVGSLHLEL